MIPTAHKNRDQFHIKRRRLISTAHCHNVEKILFHSLQTELCEFYRRVSEKSVEMSKSKFSVGKSINFFFLPLDALWYTILNLLSSDFCECAKVCKFIDIFHLKYHQPEEMS